MYTGSWSGSAILVAIKSIEIRGKDMSFTSWLLNPNWCIFVKRRSADKLIGWHKVYSEMAHSTVYDNMWHKDYTDVKWRRDLSDVVWASCTVDWYLEVSCMELIERGWMSSCQNSMTEHGFCRGNGIVACCSSDLHQTGDPDWYHRFHPLISLEAQCLWRASGLVCED